MIDCSGSFGNKGCSGGLMDKAFNYVLQNGLETETDYSYKHRDQTCKYDSDKLKLLVGELQTFKDIPKGDGQSLENAVATRVVSVGVDASPLYDYVGGVITDKGYTDIYHGVAIVGYGYDDIQEVDYWLVRNSWGQDWGEQGYFRVLKDLSVPGPGIMAIRNQASFPIVSVKN